MDEVVEDEREDGPWEPREPEETKGEEGVDGSGTIPDVAETEDAL